ncbi:hypothetical protein BKM14_14740 [Pseudomonas syringae pv. syringae]|nr:hypothetical protein BKM14_14740 [Pseudomonas syringae pv. syringae]
MACVVMNHLRQGDASGELPRQHGQFASAALTTDLCMQFNSVRGISPENLGHCFIVPTIFHITPNKQWFRASNAFFDQARLFVSRA